MKLVRISMLLALAATGQFTFAQEARNPLVRVTVEPDTVNVGQALRLRVTVLVPTWFTVPPVYPNFELANAVTRLPADSSYPISERVGRDTWSGIVRDYEVYPQLAARYLMADQTIRINYMNPDGMQPASVDVLVPEITFVAGVPSGAKSLAPFLGGSKVTLEREIDGDLSELQAGDAIVMKLRATIDGMPAMFLPVLTSAVEQPGLVAYPQEPTITDGKVAMRSEAVTYLFHNGGEFTLPAAELGWWNIASQKVEIASVPAVTIVVTGVPAGAATLADSSEKGFAAIDWRVLMSGLILVGLVVIAPGLFRSMQSRWQRARALWLRSERYAFRKLIQSVAARDTTATDRWLGLWFERLENETAVEIADLQGIDANRTSLMSGINQARYGVAGVHDQAAAIEHSCLQLGRQLRQIRAACFRAQRNQRGYRQLPPLNPPIV